MLNKIKQCKVYELPPVEVRNFIDRKVKDFVLNKIDRHSMMYSVAAILERYKLKRLPVETYEVVHNGYYEDLPKIHIFGRTRISSNCPTCGSNVYRYVQTEKELPLREYDIITAFCYQCGSIYRKLGWKNFNPGGEANAPA